MDLSRRNGHPVDQRGSNHGKVQPGIVIGYAALVDQPQVRMGPSVRGIAHIRCQELVESLRAGAAREGQVYGARLTNPLVQSSDEIIDQPFRHGFRRHLDHQSAAQPAKIALRAHGGKSKSEAAAGSARDTVVSGLRHGPCGLISSSAAAGPQLPAG